MNTQRRRSVLIGLALGVLLALLLAPQTRWLVRVQWAASLGLYHPFPWWAPDSNSYSLSLRSDRTREEAVATRHPNDFPMQFALAAAGGESRMVILARLRALKSRFPDNPSLDANALRDASLDAIRLDRNEDYLLAGQPIPKKSETWWHKPPTVEQLALFDKDATDGEKLEPDNAFFPFMRAAGLFAAHRDADGLAAVRRAGTKTQWNEHIADEPDGQWRLHAEAFGDPNALWRAQDMGSVLLPQYSLLRGVARVAAYKAVLDERAGHMEEGLAIRRALMRCGGLMRAQSRFVIGSLVGMAITQVAAMRPGGIAANTKPLTGDKRDYWKYRSNVYTAYLHKIGQNDEARWVQAEVKASQQARAVIGDLDSDTMAKSPLSKPIFRLATLWVVALLILSNILWMLIFGGLAALFRRKDIAKPSPEPRPLAAATVFFWVTLALLTELAALVAVITSEWIVTADSILSNAMLLALLAVVVMTIVFLVRLAFIGSAKRDAVSRLLRVVLVTLVLTAISLGALNRAAHWQTQCAVSIVRMEHFFTDSFQNNSIQTVNNDWSTVVCTAASLVIPFIILLVSSGVSLVRRASFLETLRVGFRNAVLPVTALLILVYGGLVLATVPQERAVNETVTRTLSQEGRYWAELAGQSWPGVTQISSPPPSSPSL
jgi:hypothetical protein